MTEAGREPIALVGMACRFPGGANDKRKFWSLLSDKVDALVDVPANRWDTEKFYHPDRDRPGRIYIRQGGFIDHPIEEFDTGFFEMSPREAAHLDPQQRLLLEVAWESLEDAGVVVDALAGSRTGVFVGGFMLDHYVMATSRDNRPLVGAYTSSGSSLTMLSARLAYTFDLRGPTISVDTACSSSLVATHYACAAIWNDECDMALVGGVNVILSPTMTLTLCKARLVSPDARCKAFDARANGYARGEGAGVVVLKPLRRALADRDHIYAVIRHSGVNQDGHSENGITAPNQDAQEALLREVYDRSGLDPRQVGYIEAHGTGTALGDRTEAYALGRILGEGRAASERFSIGSVKTNVGHLEGASGVAGLMKAALCIEKGAISANLHFETPNPEIPFDELRMHVPTEMEAWPAMDGVRTAGVNSFGYGGTNAHVILQSPPASLSGGGDVHVEPAGLRAVPLSARSEQALRARVRDFRRYLDANEPRFDDLVYTLSNRRDHHAYRTCFAASSVDGLRSALADASSDTSSEGLMTGRVPSGSRRGLVWVFTGMGPQWWGMGRELLEIDAVFRDAIEECDHHLAKYADWSIAAEMMRPEEASRMTETLFAQVGNFAIQIGVARVLARSGFEPSVAVGHSVGEVAAAYLAGAYTLEDAIRVSYHRGSLQATTAGDGKMLAVGLSEAEASALIEGRTARVSIAAINSPTSLTLSGDEDELIRIGRELEAADVFHKMLRVEVPYHSPAMDKLERSLIERVDGIRPQAPAIPLWSTVTGSPIGASELGAEYWFRNVREPVRFAPVITELAAQGYTDFLQIGPHPVLSGPISECSASAAGEATVIGSLHRKRSERAALGEAMTRLYVAGYEPRAPEDAGALIDVPSYPWQREHLWSESTASLDYRLAQGGHPLLGARVSSAPNWTSDLGRPCLDYLADHVIQEQVLMPASGYVEAALQMVRDVCGGGGLALEDVRFIDAMVVDQSQMCELHSSFDPSSGRISIRGTDGTTEHAAAWGYRLGRDRSRSEVKIDLDQVRARLHPVENSAALYALLWSRGYHYGPTFRGIQACWGSARETLARVQMPPEVEATYPAYILHPAALDVCLHSFIAGIDAVASQKTLFLPVGIERIVVHGAIDGPVWCHARRGEETEGGWTACLDLYDEDGCFLAAIDGLQVRKVRSSTMLESMPFRDWIFGADWMEAADCQAGSADGTWLVFREADSPISESVVEQLRRGGAQVRLVGGGGAPGALTVDPEDPEGYASLVRDLDELAGAVFLWGAERPPDVARLGPESGEETSIALACLIQALSGGAGKRKPRIAVVTRGVHSVYPGDVPTTPSGGISRGFLRVAINEHRGIEFRMIDLPAAPRQEDAMVIVNELLTHDNEEETAYRGGKRFVYRFTPVDMESVRRARISPRAVEEARFAFDPSPDEGGPPIFRAIAPRRVGATEVELRVLAQRVEAGWTADDDQDATSPGTGCAAVVTAIGGAVGDYRVGDEVIAWTGGALRSHMVVDESLVAPKPTGVSIADAVGFITLAGAIYSFEELLRVSVDDRVLVVVEDPAWLVALGQVARDRGLGRLFVLCPNGSIDGVTDLSGIDLVFLDAETDLRAAVRESTDGAALDAIVHVAPGFNDELCWRRLAAALTSGGRVVAIRRTADAPVPVAGRNVVVSSVTLDTLAADHPRAADRLLRRVSAGLGSGAFCLPPVEQLSSSELLGVSRGEASMVARSASFEGESIDVSNDPTRLVRSDASYVITGGLGGLGVVFAHWLVDRGARTLVLIGRSGAARPEAARAVADLEARGVRVVVGALDVADEDALCDFIAEQRELPPIAGAAHTAASFNSDALISHTTADQLRRAVRAKARGAHALSRALDGHDLDFLLMFSSVTSHMGSVGLASYSAGNAYLDSLATYLHARGVRAYSIGLGAVSDVGVLAREAHFADATERSGNIAEPAARLFAALDQLLVTNRPCWVVANIDWVVGARMYPVLVESPRFERMRNHTSGDSTDGELRERISRMKPAERTEFISVHVRDILADTFGIPADRLDMDTSIKTLGIDSLMAVQLQLAIERIWGVPMQMMALLKGPTAVEIASMISAKIEAESGTHDDALLASVDQDVLAAELERLGV